MDPAFELVGLIYGVCATGFAIPLLFIMFRKYHHWSHAGIAVGNLCVLGTFICNFVSSTSGNGSDFFAVSLVISNLLLVSAFYVILLALLLAQFERLPTASHLITFLAGALVVLFLSPNQVTAYVQDNAIAVNFSPVINTLVVAATIAFLVFAYAPLVRKIRHTQHILEEKQYLLLLLGYTVITAWAFLTPFSSVGIITNIRRLVLPTGFLLWDLALLIDPLTIIIASTRVEKVILLSKTGVPFFSYDIEHDCDIDADLISALRSAIKSSTELILTSGTSLQGIHFAESEINFISRKRSVLLLVAHQALSSNFHLLANRLIYDFEKRYDRELQKSVSNPEAYQDLKPMVLSTIRKVLL